jgi:small subunit ribosomal protein S6
VVAAAVSDVLIDEEDIETLPQGYDWYETLLILRPTLSDEDRDREVAKFEAFLNKENCLQIDSFFRGRTQLAYPMKGNAEGQYVLYTFAAKRATAKAIQHLLSNPDVGSEDNIMRFMVFRKSGRR